MPKKEALDACVTELSTSLQEMMADGETSGQESIANETLLMTRRTDPSWSAPTNGLRHRESYCLLVQDERMTSDFPNGMSDYQPTLGMRISQ